MALLKHIVLVLGFLAALPYASAAEEALPKINIAVLDYQGVLRDAIAAKKIRHEVSELRQRFQSEFQTIEQELKQEEDELRRQQSSLSASEFAEKRQAFQQKVQEAQRKAQSTRRGVDRVFDDAMKKVQSEIVPVVREITLEKGVNIVLDRSQILFAVKAMDITAEVLARLDKRLPQVPLEKIGN